MWKTVNIMNSEYLTFRNSTEEPYPEDLGMGNYTRSLIAKTAGLTVQEQKRIAEEEYMHWIMDTATEEDLEYYKRLQENERRTTWGTWTCYDGIVRELEERFLKEIPY